jgi:hypothetical protein
MPSSELERRRRSVKRPLRDLTDEELQALVDLQQMVPLARESLAERWETLSSFAFEELNERDLAKALREAKCATD